MVIYSVENYFLNLYLPAPAPNLYLPTLTNNYITSPGPDFAYTLSPLFVFVFTALTHNLYYRSGACICVYLIIGSSSSASVFSIGLNPDTLNHDLLIAKLHASGF